MLRTQRLFAGQSAAEAHVMSYVPSMAHTTMPFMKEVTSTCYRLHELQMQAPCQKTKTKNNLTKVVGQPCGPPVL